MTDCIFCKIINKEIPAYTVWEGERFVSFLDMRPAQLGHILIIPKEHHENIFAMPDDLYQELFNIAKALSTPLQEAMASIRIGSVVEGFGVPHAHLHLIPINRAHDLDSINARTLPDEEMKQIQEKIKNKLNNAVIEK